MRLRDTVDLLILAAVFGASFLFMRVAGPEFGPVALVELRVGIAALFLLPIFILRGDILELKTHWKTIAWVGVLNSAIPFSLLAFATLYLSGGFASIINATAPLWGAMIAWIWLSERLNVSRIAGLLVGFSGVVVLVWNKVSPDFARPTLAVLAAIGAAMFYGLGANYARKYLRGVSPLVTATGNLLAATLLLLPAAVLYWPLDPVSIQAWVSVTLMAIASTGIAYLLYFRLIENVGPARAITVTYLVPAFAMLWGAIFIGETVTVKMILGCLIIFLGTALATGILYINKRSESITQAEM